MTTQPGTFEAVATILGEAIAPLAERLHPDNAVQTLAELGAFMPPGTFSPTLRSALGAAATAAGELPALVADLTGAIESDAGAAAIAAAAVRVAEKAGRFIEATVTIADQFAGITVPGIPPAELAALAAALPARLLELTLLDHLTERMPVLVALLTLLGAVEEERINPGSLDPAKPESVARRLRLDRLGTLFTDPEELLRDVYGWGDPTFAAPELLRHAAALLTALGVQITHTDTDGPDVRPAVELFTAVLAGTAAGTAPPGLEAILALAAGDGFGFTVPVRPGLDLVIGAHGTAKAATAVRVQPPAVLTVVPPSGDVQGELTAGLELSPVAPAEAVTLLGVAGGTSLSARKIGLGAKAHFEWDLATGRATGDVGLEGRIEGGRLVISLASADGFIGALMAGFGLAADFDLGFGWSAGGGVYFTGTGGLDIVVPTHLTLGPVEIQNIRVRIGVDATGFPIDLTATIKAALGPVSAVVEHVGARALLAFPPDHDGNLGVADLSVAFKPPTGVGLTVNAGVVKGGGYLYIDPDRGEYAGALELVLAEFLAISAIGLITTKNPDGSPGFSLLLVLAVDFGTGIQLGLGFTLIAVGGLVGLNRTMNLQALMQGVRTNAIESVMFPRDVVANAPRILSDLRTFFPAKPGTFLIGPMLKLGWGTPPLVTASLGVIIEIPGNIAIVGVLKVALPTADAPLIVLQVNFAGAIEADKKRLYFFASLFDSRVLFMTIEGEMGLLVAWGDDANLVVSVGGFHPRFTPPPLPFPVPQRVSVTLVDTGYARIRVSGYFAVTSNTAQFGARAEVFFGFSGCSVEGHLAFDAMFQFSPFHFIIGISASVSFKVGGVGLFGIRLQFDLEGPSAWRARGSGSISLLFFEISADFDITWGEETDTTLPAVEALPLVATEFRHDQAWSALLPSGATPMVTLRALGAGTTGELVLHPVGTLQVRQRAIPLDTTVDKVGNRRTADATRFTVSVLGTSLRESADLDEQFALGQYQDLDDAARLSRPAYQPQHGGVEITPTGAGAGTGRMVRRTVRYEEVVVDNRYRRRPFRFRPVSATFFNHLAAGCAVARSPRSATVATHLNPHGDDAIAVTTAAYVVASTATNTATATFTSEAAAHDHLTTLVSDDPNLVDTLHVIPAHEAIS